MFEQIQNVSPYERMETFRVDQFIRFKPGCLGHQWGRGMYQTNTKFYDSLKLVELLPYLKFLCFLTVFLR